MCIRKRRPDVSFLHHFIETFLPEDIRTLHLFCDSCGGQNKNYTVFRYLHWLIHGQQRFEQIHMTFPVRGHSYLECDKNMGLINQKSRVEIPNEWNEVIRAARRKPSPFHVVEVQQDFIYNWTSYFKNPFKKKCPFQTRPVTEIKFCQEHPRTVNIRTTYNGQWESYDVIDKAFIKGGLEIFHKENPHLLYDNKIPVPRAKFEDLQVLKRFCSESAQEFYNALPYCSTVPDHEDDEVSPVISGVKV